MGRAVGSKNLLEHISYNTVGGLLPLVVMVVTIPIYISIIGPERYALIALLWMVLGYSVLFDLGLSRATTNEIAKIPVAEVLRTKSAILTVVQLNVLLGAIGGIIFVVLFRIYGSRISEHQADVVAEFLSAGWMIALCVPTVTVSASLLGILDARGRFFISNTIQSLGFICLQTFPLILLQLNDTNIGTVVVGTLTVRYVFLFVAFVVVIRIFRISSYATPDIGLVRRMLGYGGWITVTNLVSPLLVTIDQFIIAHVLGPKALAPYNIASAIAARLLLFPNAIARAVFPRLSIGVSDRGVGTASEMLVLTAASMTVLWLGATSFSQPLLSWWLGQNLGLEVYALIFPLLIGIWINSLGYIPYTYLQATGRPDLVAKIHMLELVPYVLSLWLALHQWGLQAMPYVWSGRVLIDCIMLAFASRLPAKIWLQILPLLLIMTVHYLVLTIAPGVLWGGVLFFALSFLVFAVCGRFLGGRQSIFVKKR